MSKYYYLVAGLPNLTIEDRQLPFTVSEFSGELRAYHLRGADLRLLDLLFLKFDNANLLGRLRQAEYDMDGRGTISVEAIDALLEGLRGEGVEERAFVNRNWRLPLYFESFARMYLAGQGEGSQGIVSWEDRLAALYYDYGMKSDNAFVAVWFELNLNINNILTAVVCRKYGLDRAAYIVGETEVAARLRTSNARDFELDDTLEYLPVVMRIGEERDLLLRETRIDRLKWEWLEAQTLDKTFDIESVLAYLLKLEMTERWALLNKGAGERTFRNLVGAMKKGSANALGEFQRNNA